MATNETALKNKNTASDLDLKSSDLGFVRGYEVDVLSQFKANLQQVEDLNSRLRYALTEVSSLIKRR